MHVCMRRCVFPAAHTIAVNYWWQSPTTRALISAARHPHLGQFYVRMMLSESVSQLVGQLTAEAAAAGSLAPTADAAAAAAEKQYSRHDASINSARLPDGQLPATSQDEGGPTGVRLSAGALPSATRHDHHAQALLAAASAAPIPSEGAAAAVTASRSVKAPDPDGDGGRECDLDLRAAKKHRAVRRDLWHRELI